MPLRLRWRQALSLMTQRCSSLLGRSFFILALRLRGLPSFNYCSDGLGPVIQFRVPCALSSYCLQALRIHLLQQHLLPPQLPVNCLPILEALKSKSEHYLFLRPPGLTSFHQKYFSQTLEVGFHFAKVFKLLEWFQAQYLIHWDVNSSRLWSHFWLWVIIRITHAYRYGYVQNSLDGGLLKQLGAKASFHGGLGTVFYPLLKIWKVGIRWKASQVRRNHWEDAALTSGRQCLVIRSCLKLSSWCVMHPWQETQFMRCHLLTMICQAPSQIPFSLCKNLHAPRRFKRAYSEVEIFVGGMFFCHNLALRRSG